MKKDNWNEDRNCAYGILNGHDLPSLFEEIVENGIDLVYKERVRVVRTHIESCVEEVAEETSFIQQIIEKFDEDVIPYADMQNAENGVNYTSLVDGMVEAVLEGEEQTEHSYRYELTNQYNPFDGSATILLKYDGHGWLLWIIDSDYVTYASRAQQMVAPNAGDLRSPGEFEVDEFGGRPITGWPCLALPPWVWKQYGKSCPYYARPIDKQGHAVEGSKWVNE